MPLEQQQERGQENEDTPAVQMPLCPPKLSIHPPLLNTACPWATTEADLAALLSCTATGAVTTRTSLLGGFAHDDAAHRFVLFDPATTITTTTTTAAAARRGDSVAAAAAAAVDDDVCFDDARKAEERPAAVGSVNSLGYSPVTLDGYLAILARLSGSLPAHTHRKTVIVSLSLIHISEPTRR